MVDLLERLRDKYFKVFKIGVSSQALFKYLDVLVFVEGVIYSMDEENERATQSGQCSIDEPLQGLHYLHASIPPSCLHVTNRNSAI